MMANKDRFPDGQSFCLVYLATAASEDFLFGDLKSSQWDSVRNITKRNR